MNSAIVKACMLYLVHSFGRDVVFSPITYLAMFLSAMCVEAHDQAGPRSYSIAA